MISQWIRAGEACIALSRRCVNHTHRGFSSVVGMWVCSVLVILSLAMAPAVRAQGTTVGSATASTGATAATTTATTSATPTGAARPTAAAGPGAPGMATGVGAATAAAAPGNGSPARSTPATAGSPSTVQGSAGEAASRSTDAAGKPTASAEAANDNNTNRPPAPQDAAANAAQQQTDFQRFVQEATGRTLGLYGFDLFARGNFQASQGASVPATYVLGPGDEVVAQAYGLLDFTERLVIDREGRVLVPKAGPLTLAGVSLGDAEKVLSAHLGKIYRNFNLTVTMGRVRSAEVFVVGQARNPGKHVVSGLSTLINALFETGGPNANGSLRAGA